MIGTILNTIAILLGGFLGLTLAKDLSAVTQARIKIALGAFTIFVGFRMTWNSLNGSIGEVIGQFGIVMLALVLGNALGKLIGLQRGLNLLGQYAKERFTNPGGTGTENRVSEGFITCTILFCVGPMAILGALQDGLTGNFSTLAIKSVMDGLATMAFTKTFGWGVMLSSIPVLAYQGTITIAARGFEPFLADRALLDSLGATGGLLICFVSLIILGLKKIPLADYLPSLAIAPLLTWMWKT